MVLHQETPDGTMAVVFSEADDIPASMQALATSDHPFDRWFRELLKEVHGIDLSEGGPPPSWCSKRPLCDRTQGGRAGLDRGRARSVRYSWVLDDGV
jgi:hypothetical protein